MPNSREFVFDDPYLLITDRKISAVTELVPLMEKVLQVSKNFVVVADDVDGEALATLVVNKLRGTVNVLGRSALDAKDRIGYLPEERGLYRRMRIRDFLRFIANLKGITKSDADARIATWLERLELEGIERRRCEELSKGQQQKIQFIASVLHDPDVLILDEPWSLRSTFRENFSRLASTIATNNA